MLFNEMIGFRNSCGVRATLGSFSYYPFHIHENILEIICVLNGEIQVYYGAICQTLTHGDVYFFNPDDCHKIVSDDENSIILTLHIDLMHFKEYFRDCNGQKDYDMVKDEAFFSCDSFRFQSKDSNDMRYLRFLIANVYKEYTSDRLSEISLEKAALDLMKFLMNHHRNYLCVKFEDGTYSIVQLDKAYADNPNESRIHRITEFIYSHYNEKISLDTIAKEEYLSTSYLSNYIKKSFGISFKEFLTIARCEAAVRLLGMTSKSLDEIAAEVGFSNRSHLTTQFKKWFFQSPSQYRKDILADISEEGKLIFNTFDYNFAMLIINSYLDGY